MKTTKRMLAVIIMLTIMISMFNTLSTLPVSGTGGDFEIVNLKTNDEVCPVIDDAPRFSWQMASDITGKSQTAYQIVVKQGSATIWDSGKQAGDTSVGIAYEGPELAPSTVYSWTATMWDETDAPATSNPAGFETGLGADASAWNDSSWIAENPSGASDVPDASYDLHYVVEADVAVEKASVGIIFNYLDNKNFLMWQVNTETAGQVRLRPHRWLNGTAAANWPVNNLPGLTNTSGKTEQFHLKIDVTQTTVTAFINDTQVSSLAFSTLGLSPKLTPIGVHSGTGASGVVDNLTLTDYSRNPEDGEVVYAYDFEGTETPLPYNPYNTNVVTSVENGELKVSGNGWALPKPPGDLHYVVEADVSVEKTAVGIIFNYQDSRNMLMWQINTGTAGQVRLRPHNRVGGTWSVVNPITIDLPGVTNDSGKTAPVHLKIDVTKTTITTYVNDTQVDSREVSSMGLQPIPGPVGGHSGGNEGGYIDNLKMTDYTNDSVNGEAVYDFDFNNGVNPLISDPQGNLEPAPVVDGRLYQFDNKWSLPQGTAKSPFPSFRKKVNISGEVEWARLYATALGAFDMYIDGDRVGVKTGDEAVYDELKPGYTSASKRVHYYTYDVTDSLQSNETHLISAQLAKGWYGGLSGGISSTLALRAKLLVKYAGQSSPTVIGTDGSWKTDYPSGFMFASIYDGETFDGNVSDAWRSDLTYNDST